MASEGHTAALLGCGIVIDRAVGEIERADFNGDSAAVVTCLIAGNFHGIQIEHSAVAAHDNTTSTIAGMPAGNCQPGDGYAGSGRDLGKDHAASGRVLLNRELVCAWPCDRQSLEDHELTGREVDRRTIQ